MNDKNGIELRTGQVVEITGGFFKADNGRFVVVHSPGDAGWLGDDYSLRRVSKKNEISLAKNAFAFWPLDACTNDYAKNIEADTHNREHARIEIIGEIEAVEIKEEIAEYERRKKHWRGGSYYLDTLQKKIDELKAQLIA